MMSFENKKILITGAYRDFGKTLARHFAKKGAELFLTVRGQKAVAETITFFADLDIRKIHVFDCDLTNVNQIKALSESIEKVTNNLDILVNNAAMWLQGNLGSVTDEEIANTVNSGITGNIVLIKRLEKLLLRSKFPDIVNMVSVCGMPNYSASNAHEAFYAMKHGQTGFSKILTDRMKAKQVRVISVYPPDFNNIGDDLDLWEKPELAQFGEMLTSREIVDVIDFALTRPRSCMINQIVFEDTRV